MNIPFWLDGTAAPLPQLDYLPYGTRSLRIEVRTNRPMPALRLRPHHRLPEESANGIFRGFEDEGTTFQLSWGGGTRRGRVPAPRTGLGRSRCRRPCPRATSRLSSLI